MSRVSSEIKDDHYFSGKWLRKTTDSEKEMEIAHQEGHVLIWYQLDLSSVEPLQESHVRTALGHLYRKVPNLSICFGTHEGDMWLRRPTNPNVDFKVLHGLRLEEVRESLRKYHYKSDTGPLFCARLLRGSPDNASDSVDLEPSFPNKSHIFFGLHHGMTDGRSNIIIMGFFISLLNDIISNKPVNDEEPLGTFPSGEETLRLITEKKLLLEGDPELKEKIAQDMQFRKEQIPFIIKGFDAPKENEHTASVVRVLDQDTTTKFIQRCRQEKITVNSAFTAVVNMAIVDVLIQHGILHDCYVIQNFHIVDLRRYWESKSSQTLGIHVSYPLAMYTKTPKDVHDKFWDYAKELGEILKYDILSGRILSDKAYAMLTSENTFSSKENLHAHNRYEGDFLTSNMGDITAIVTEGGDHVKITNLVRGTTIIYEEYPVLLTCHTFRGRLNFTFDYNTGCVSAVLAKEICSQIMKCLLEIVE